MFSKNFVIVNWEDTVLFYRKSFEKSINAVTLHLTISISTVLVFIALIILETKQDSSEHDIELNVIEAARTNHVTGRCVLK